MYVRRTGCGDLGGDAPWCTCMAECRKYTWHCGPYIEGNMTEIVAREPPYTAGTYCAGTCPGGDPCATGDVLRGVHCT